MRATTLFKTAIILVALAVTGPAWGAKSAIDLRLVDPALGDLPLGKDLKGALGWVRAQLTQTYGPLIKKAFDATEREKLRARLTAEIEAVSRSVVLFDGKRTGFEVSVVKDEYMVGNDESVLVYREPGGLHYLFFLAGKLYKYARPLDTKEPFSLRFQAMTRDLGKPAEAQKTERDDGQGDRFTAATWVGRRVQVRLAEFRRLYQTDLLVVEDKAIAERVANLRKKRGLKKAGPGLDPELDGILGGDDDDESYEWKTDDGEDE